MKIYVMVYVYFWNIVDIRLSILIIFHSLSIFPIQFRRIVIAQRLRPCAQLMGNSLPSLSKFVLFFYVAKILYSLLNDPSDNLL